jgi:hypothetical protein
MVEEWRDIKGFEGRYQVSNFGRVKSLSRVTQLNGRVRTEPEKIMSYTLRSGYPTLILRKEGKRYSRQIHRLVAEAFIPNPDNLPIVNHKDFTRTNNCVDNLKWCSVEHNVRWSIENMKHPKNSRLPTSGEKYIEKNVLKNGGVSYSVYIRSASVSLVPCKTFKTLEDAVKYRDEQIQKKKYFRKGA